MQNKNLLIILGILVILALAAAGYYFLGKTGIESPGNNIKQEETGNIVSPPEEINQEKMAEYITGESYLAKLSIGAAMDSSKAVKTNEFGLQGQICIGFTLKKAVASGTLATVLYDVDAKSEARAKSIFYQPLGTGERFGCEESRLEAGKYEYKLYIENELVLNLPFEVK